MPADSNTATHEEAFVNRFIYPDYRGRLAFELGLRNNPTRRVERRGRFLRRFNHDALKYLDHRFVIRLKPPNSNPTILRLLNSKGAERTCYAISSADSIDGRNLPLSEALEISVGFGMPTILSCVAGRLAFLETEQEFGPPDRFILFHSPSARE